MLTQRAAVADVQPDSTDETVLENVDRYLQRGLTLKSWYDRVFPSRGFARKFDLSRTENRPDESFGFFDEIVMDGAPMAIMGNYQEMFYDQPGVGSEFYDDPRGWLNQLREFVLHYFMRVSTFADPASTINEGTPNINPALTGFSFCLASDALKQGFGFSQLYWKKRDTGEVFKFSAHEKFAIMNLMEAATSAEWLILRVQIFNFAFKLQPFGDSGPEVNLNLNEASYLILSPSYIINDETPDGDTIARYGFGYSFMRNPEPGVLAYGPGEFDAAFESIEFEVSRSGRTTVRMAFVANQPKQIARISIDPLHLGSTLADKAAGSALGRLFPKISDSLSSLYQEGFDPVYAYVALANAVTFGWATEGLCISREQLNKRFLLQHFAQHYQTLAGSLATWRQIHDWLDEAALPKWVTTGGLISG